MLLRHLFFLLFSDHYLPPGIFLSVTVFFMYRGHWFEPRLLSIFSPPVGSLCVPSSIMPYFCVCFVVWLKHDFFYFPLFPVDSVFVLFFLEHYLLPLRIFFWVPGHSFFLCSCKWYEPAVDFVFCIFLWDFSLSMTYFFIYSPRLVDTAFLFFFVEHHLLHPWNSCSATGAHAAGALVRGCGGGDVCTYVYCSPACTINIIVVPFVPG